VTWVADRRSWIASALASRIEWRAAVALERPRAPTASSAIAALGQHVSAAVPQPSIAAALDWAPWLLAALVLATRLPLVTRTLYAFDSANYALAVRDAFDVARHQPHPPGYPLYVAIARLIDVAVGDANRSLVVEGILLSAVAVLTTAWLGRALYGRAAGVLAGLLLLFTVGFWGYGEVAYPYVGLAAEVATLALLAHLTLAGRKPFVLMLGAAWGISAGIRWDGAVFGSLLWLWALWTVPWRLRLGSLAIAVATVFGWAIPMVQLTGGWDAYRQALADYLHVWGPQSAFVVGEFQTGGETQATYNLNFFVNYVRNMLGIGVLVVLYVLGKRFGPAALASDYRSRFLVLWVVPPIGTYLFSHLGEPGYVLSLAPQSAVLIALGCLDLGGEARTAAAVLLRRMGPGARRLAAVPRVVGVVATGALVAAIVGWNVQAFARGVGPGRLPDLRAHDVTTSDQVGYVRAQAPGTTLVLAHDILRQVEFYAPATPVVLQYSEYVPDWERVRTTTTLPPGVAQVVVLDSPLQVPAADAGQVHEVVLGDAPRVSVWVVDVRGAAAVEHGYHWLHVVP
jgi:hypothetical protein